MSKVRKLIKDWVLAKPYSSGERQTKSGIIVPDVKRERADKAIVLEVGDGIKDIKIGDKVAFLRFGPIEIEIDGDNFLFIKEEDIIAIL